MFTVKHRAEDGTETLYSAERVEVLQGKGQHVDGIYLDWPETPPYGPGEAVPPRPPAKHVIAITSPYKPQTGAGTRDMEVAGLTGGPPVEVLRGDSEGATWVPRVWIMNEAGQTVATYDL